MNKADLISVVAQKADVSKKDATKVVDAVVCAIETALKNDEKVQLVGFGTFEVRKRAERQGRNPRTKAVIKIPASKVPVFKPGKALKDNISK